MTMQTRELSIAQEPKTLVGVIIMGDRQSILFLCTTNSCRSQMAEGIIKHEHGDRFEVRSAGAESTSDHPLAIKVMYEVGIDISQQSSKTVEGFLGRKFDYVITLCGENTKEVCPAFPGEATT